VSDFRSLEAGATDLLPTPERELLPRDRGKDCAEIRIPATGTCSGRRTSPSQEKPNVMAGKKSSKKKWVGDVKTASTFPPKDIFTKDARTIARVMASKKVSPKGLGSAVRMVQYFINRGGKNLSATRRRELEKAKGLLQERAQREKS
jgi:tRNA(adenine34) deaminase